MNTRKKENGFTIIEVVLVLAIAGLIFLMVFIALPALQRSQRDTQRKNDLSRMMNAITSYSSNNRGNVPNAVVADLNDFATKYLKSGGDTFQDPAGSDYTFNTPGLNALSGSYSTDNSGVIYYSKGASCDTSDSSKVVTSSARKVAVRMYLEGGGIACQNN